MRVCMYGCMYVRMYACMYVCMYINSSKEVWKSEFDQLLLSYLSNNRRMLGIIRKSVKFSVK